MPQPRGFGVSQTVLPVSHSRAVISTSVPPGARITRSPSISGHCPAYQGGTLVPYSATRSFAHFFSPVVASRQVTWQSGPIAITYLSVTVGMVRLTPWLRLTCRS